MKKVLSVIMSAVLILALFSGSAFAGNGNGNGNGKDKEMKFKDIEKHWGRQSVEKIQSKGIMNGYDDGTFLPDKTLTGAELAVILERLYNLKSGKYEENDDEERLVEDDDLEGVPGWAKKAVKEGFKKNYLNLKRFHSEQQINRLEACVAVAKALEELGELKPIDIEDEGIVNPFKDRVDISDDDYGYIVALYQARYITGYPGGNFNPNALLTRAQIAAILDKILDDDDDDSKDNNDPEWYRARITASAITAESVKLVWSGAEDDEGVTGYKVTYKQDSTTIVKYTRYERIVINGLDAEEEYLFKVEARDAAENWSSDGPSIEVKTLKEEETDTEAPEWPDGAVLTISSSISGIVTIQWPAATDNEGVDKYKLYLDGQLIETLDGDENSTIVSDLDSNTRYTFKLRAVDEEGNLSPSLTKIYRTH